MPKKKSKISKTNHHSSKRENKDSRFEKFKATYLTKKYLTIYIIIILLLITLFLFKNQIIVATVNGEPITRFTLINELESKSGKRALESIITKTLVIQEARKKNISVTEAEINDEIKKIEENLKKQGQTLDDVLKLQGTNIETVREQIKLNLLMKKLLEKDIAVTDKEVSEYIDKNKGTKPENLSDDEYKKQVKNQLEQQKFQEKAQAYIKKLQDNSRVNYYLNF